MITINKNGFTPGDYKFAEAVEYRGLSTDAKPLDAANGSVFLEIDTGSVFCYDAEGKTWIPW